MLTTKAIQPFICFSESSLEMALQKINQNKSRIIFVVDQKCKLLGCLSDGDVRRWLIEASEIDISIPVQAVMNKELKSALFGSSIEQIEKYFLPGINCIPIIDQQNHLVELAFNDISVIKIDQRIISEQSPVFVIAEIGNNHQGDISLAKDLIDQSIAAGVDCVKFQMRDMSALYSDLGCNSISRDLGTQYTLDLLQKFQLSDENLFALFDYAKSKGVIPLCTPWDLPSLKKLEHYGMPAYKVASADFTNFELLAAIANTGKPFFCSCGMSTESEIQQTISLLKSLSAKFILMHCNSTYPTPYKDVNLKYLNKLKSLSNGVVGYSGHDKGITMALASVALGARVVEKHITLDKHFEGVDHKVSLLPNEFAELVAHIRTLEVGLGSDNQIRELTQGEMINRENLAKSLFAKQSIKLGDIISRDAIEIKSPGQGLQPNKLDQLVGKPAIRAINKGDCFFASDLTTPIEKRHYFFKRPYGVPVRYHDFQQIIQGSNLNFVEFHLSYRDLEVPLDSIFDKSIDMNFAVHCPELFEGDHLLDLAAFSDTYLQQSLHCVRQTIAVTKQLKTYFTQTESPIIIINVGGWDRSGFISQSLKQKKYSILTEALSQLDLSGVTLAIQTMPPFPWHFGGQSFHNLFVAPDEVSHFCQQNPEIKVCLDLSHSMMACNHYGWNFNDFVKAVMPYTVHLHIADAKHVDGEGVEIGQGDIDFFEVMSLLDTNWPTVQFIPEIWQGHRNGGEGFWRALDYLEKVSP